MSNLEFVAKKGIVTQSVIAVISAAIALFIGIWVISSVINSISTTNFTAAANTTYASVQNTMWSALQLLSVGLIVLAASVILAYFGFGRRE